MGRKSFRDETKIVELHKKYKKLTDGYSKFSADILLGNPQLLLIIRLACGLPQREFSKILKFDRSALVHSELGISKTMKTGNAERIYKILLSLIDKANFSEEFVLESYRKFLQQASSGQPAEKLRQYGRMAFKHKKQTIQECQISNILESLRIPFEKEGILTLDGMEFFFEFLIPNSQHPKVVIECKNAQTKNKRSLKIVGYRISYEIGYKSYMIHKNYPKTKIVVIIQHNHERLPERVLKILEKETDELLINSGNKEISSKIKELCRAFS